MNRELQDYGWVLKELGTKHLKMVSQTKIKQIYESNLTNKIEGVFDEIGESYICLQK